MILQILLATITFLISIWGVTTLLAGFATFFMLPMISKVSRFKIFSRFFLRLATFPLKRAAFVVSESNETYFKQLNLELGMLSTTLDGDTKMIEDPAQRLHHWLGIRFGLVDEEHGVVFDPRDAANGMRKKEYNDKDEGEFLATEAEWDKWGVTKWKPAVFAHPSQYELVDLSAVQELIDGGERSEFAERVEELYKHSQDPFGDSTAIGKFLYPILGFAGPFFGIWILKSQLGGPSSTVSFGVLGLLLASLGGLDIRSVFDSISVRDVAAYVALLAPPLLIEALLLVFLGPIMAIAVNIVFLLGLLIMPLLTLTGKASSAIGGGLSKLYFKMGFMGYRKPVIEWTPKKYVIREYDQLDTAEQRAATWYDAFGSLVGFTFRPGKESWGAEYLSHMELESQQPVADGGKRAIESNIPQTYVRTDQMQRDSYGGFIPKRVRDSETYVHSGIAMNRFKNSAIGEKSLRKLLEAKDEHGGGSDELSDSTVLKATTLTTIFGAVAGIGVHILPGIL